MDTSRRRSLVRRFVARFSMPRGRYLRLTALVIVLFLMSTPLFFAIYRDAAFNTTPRDDYGPYLQYIVGAGGQVPGAPMAYRFLSVAIGVPFYFLLPVYSFTNLANLAPSYLRATEALAAVSYLSLLATGVVIYLTCRRRLGATQKASVIAGLLSLALSMFVAQVGIDPLGLLMVSALLFVIDRPVPFAVLLLLSVGIYEKIVLLLAIVVFVRFVFGRHQRLLPQLIVCAIGVATYLLLRLLVHVPGYENQLTPSTYVDSFFRMLSLFFSLKGLVTNLVPTAVIAFLACLGYWTLGRLQIVSSAAQKADVLVFLVMALIGMAIDVEFTLGRLVVFAYPLYLPIVSCWIDHALAEPSAGADG
jgi:hypothetical protein